MLRKILAVLAVSAAVTAGTLTATTGPATAAPGCPVNAICFHNTSTSNPNEWRDFADTSPGECHGFSSSANNTASWVTNRTSYVWYVYTNALCNSFPAGTIYANSSGAMTGSWNNSISSYRRG